MTIIGEEIKKVLGAEDLEKKRAARKGGKPGEFNRTLAEEMKRPGKGSMAEKPAATVEISESHRQADVARKAIDQAPDIRWDRVEELKSRINAGTYNVSAEQLAEKMLADPEARRLLLD